MSNKRALYRVGRFILGPIFRLYYNPKIIGKENILDKDSIVIAGNHIHLYDQCSTIISNKRIITYMAKKEYFDSKKTAWFFKSVGCIPVDRKIKDREAVSSALDVLSNGGAIGIFPEGTRNSFKDEKIVYYHDEYFNEMSIKELKKKVKRILYSQIVFLENLYKDNKIKREDFIQNFFNVSSYLEKLKQEKVITKDEYDKSYFLPLKFGAVSLAYKTGAKVVPVLVTGDYKFRSKNLVIKFGKPFKVTNDNLEYFNNKLLNELINLKNK